MKTTVGRICDAMSALTTIGNRTTAAIPNKGRYQLARLRAKLQPEYDTIQKQRDQMIETIGVKQTVNAGEGQMVETGNYIIPPEKTREWSDAWAEFAKEEIDLPDIAALKYETFHAGDDRADGGLEVGELMLLGEFID